MIKLLICITMFLIVSCSFPGKDTRTGSNKIETEDITLAPEKNSDPHNGFDTIHLKNQGEKKLLVILAMLPDSAMGRTWSWPIKERVMMVDSAVRLNYIVNRSKMYLIKEIMNETHFRVSVVDGYWELKLFPVSANEYIILTHNVTGDNDEFFSYSYKNAQLMPIFLDKIFPLYLNAFFREPKNESCKEKPDADFQHYLDFVLDKRDTIEVYNYYAKNDSICFKGNTLDLVFNKTNKTFDTSNVYWKKLK